LQVSLCVFLLYSIVVWRGTDTSLARPTSRCCRTESILSSERGVSSCAELQVFSCYTGWERSPFLSNAEVIAATETWLDGRPSDLFIFLNLKFFLFFFYFIYFLFYLFIYLFIFIWVACKSWSNGLRSVLSFTGSMLNKSRDWSL
jgi:hypothetical protein